MNYAELVEAVQHYTENRESGFVALIPTFVRQAEERIYNSVKLPALRRTQINELESANPYLTVPDDYLAPFVLSVVLSSGAHQSLLPKDVSFIREAYPLPTTYGMPKYYAQFDANTLLMAPTPYEQYSVQLHYYYKPVSIVDAGTSWVGDNFPPVLLNATLVEAYVNMKGDKDVMDMYEKQFKEALALLKKLGEGFNQRDSFRNGEPSLRGEV